MVSIFQNFEKVIQIIFLLSQIIFVSYFLVENPPCDIFQLWWHRKKSKIENLKNRNHVKWNF